MNILSTNPFLAIRPAAVGWEILVQPGPLADLLSRMVPINGHGHCYDQISERTIEVIPFSQALDDFLVKFIDTLIDLRYETGRVQLELFSTRDL